MGAVIGNEEQKMSGTFGSINAIMDKQPNGMQPYPFSDEEIASQQQ